MKASIREIADAGMLSEGKVTKDLQRGKFDRENLGDVLRYVHGHRLLAGGLSVFDGMMAGCVEGESTAERYGVEVSEEYPEAPQAPVVAVATSTPPVPVVTPAADWRESKWSDFEEEFMMGRMRLGTDRKVAERGVLAMRVTACVERLGPGDAEELGI